MKADSLSRDGSGSDQTCCDVSCWERGSLVSSASVAVFCRASSLVRSHLCEFFSALGSVSMLHARVANSCAREQDW